MTCCCVSISFEGPSCQVILGAGLLEGQHKLAISLVQAGLLGCVRLFCCDNIERQHALRPV